MTNTPDNPMPASTDTATAVKPPRRPVKSTLLYIALLISGTFAAWQMHIYFTRPDVDPATTQKPLGSTASLGKSDYTVPAHELPLSGGNMLSNPASVVADMGIYPLAVRPPVAPPTGAKLTNAMGRAYPMIKGHVELLWTYAAPQPPEPLHEHYRAALKKLSLPEHNIPLSKNSWLFGNLLTHAVRLTIIPNPKGLSRVSLIVTRPGRKGDFDRPPAPAVPKPKPKSQTQPTSTR